MKQDKPNHTSTMRQLPNITTHCQAFASRLPPFSGQAPAACLPGSGGLWSRPLAVASFLGRGGLTPVEVSPVVNKQAKANEMINNYTEQNMVQLMSVTCSLQDKTDDEIHLSMDLN